MSRPTASSSSSQSSLVPTPSLTLQLSQLRQPTNAVSGVYLFPSPTSPRAFHGVLFLHQGPYAGAIFPFHLELPREALGGTSTRTNVVPAPKLTFTQPIPHPLVHPHTHQLRLTRHFPTWDPSHHTLPKLLSTLKSLFKEKVLRSVTRNEASNAEIWTLLHSNEVLFRKLVGQAVQHSVSSSALYGASTARGAEEKAEEDDKREGFAFRELDDAEYERLKREILG